MKPYSLFLLFAVPAAMLSGCGGHGLQPEKFARLAAERIIDDSAFELVEAKQKPLAFPCIVDATPFAAPAGRVTADGTIRVDENGSYRFGFTASGACAVRINGREVFRTGDAGEPFPREIAYGTFEFPHHAQVDLRKGDNTFTVQTNDRVSFGALDDEDFAAGGIAYAIDLYRDAAGKTHQPPVYTQKKIPVPDHAAFQKHPYLEWHYANGTTMFGILSLADLTQDARYGDFVKEFCRFTLEHEPLFRHQYFVQNSLRTQNYRMFRCTMLDDSSAPALPFLELHLRGELPGTEDFLKRFERFVMTEQPRLSDGTFARPEPRWTIWGDDLFMSSLFLLRYGKLTGDNLYYDEVARQIENFDRYLYNPEAKLYHHAWNATRNEPMGQFWGRANGWVVWATSEALLNLPKTHDKYEKILEIHRRQLSNLAGFQGESGMWHQVLNLPESYEETSCTAIFTMAMARAVRHGWIDGSYRRRALDGWAAIERQIDPETGVISGICESMPIGPDLDFYLTRGTQPSDPRGAGAVIAAAVEIARLIGR